MKFPGKNAFKTLKTKFVLYSVLPLPTQRKRFFHQLHLKKKKKKEWLETLTLMQHPSKWLVCLNKVDVSLKVLSLMWSRVVKPHSGPGLWWIRNCKYNNNKRKKEKEELILHHRQFEKRWFAKLLVWCPYSDTAWGFQNFKLPELNLHRIPKIKNNSMKYLFPMKLRSWNF